MNNSRVIHSQDRHFIYNVYKFFKKEQEKNNTISSVLKMVVEATGISKSSVQRIIKEGEPVSDFSSPSGSSGNIFKSPRKKINQPKPKTNVDGYEGEFLRNTVYTFAMIHGSKPTMSAVYNAVKNELNFQGKL
uniref:Uncharacterized protein LOC114339944 n=1 Tax=Diabrotica virgifera virgifera TaxID=50390 RepID=A0A6P7GAU0_DIAVI